MRPPSPLGERSSIMAAAKEAPRTVRTYPFMYLFLLWILQNIFIRLLNHAFLVFWEFQKFFSKRFLVGGHGAKPLFLYPNAAVLWMSKESARIKATAQMETAAAR